MLELVDGRFKKMAVLVVDDDLGMARMTGELLRELGFGRVAHASDGGSAVQKLSQGKFDIVISDWNMEPMSGLELVKHIRKDRQLAAIAFVMVSGRNDPHEVGAAKAAGIDGYLLKPFTLANLKKQLARALSRVG